MLQGKHASVRKILRIDELVPVPSASHCPHTPSLVNKLEQNRQQPKAAEVNNGRTADNYGSQIAVFMNDLLRREL